MGKEQFFMSNSNTISDKQEFIKKLELIRDLEAEKPVEEMDVSLIKACVELILELQDKKASLSTEDVEEKVRNIPFVDTASLNTMQSIKSRATKVKSRKILLIAAILALLVMLFSISSIATEWDVFDRIRNMFGMVANAPVNEEMELDGITVVLYGKAKTYHTPEEAVNSLGVDILYPTKLPKGVQLTQISIVECDPHKELVFTFDGEEFCYSINIDTAISEDIKDYSTEIIEKDGIVYYITYMQDLNKVQISFEYNSDLYWLSYNNKQDLIEVIESFKEFKNEN